MPQTKMNKMTYSLHIKYTGLLCCHREGVGHTIRLRLLFSVMFKTLRGSHGIFRGFSWMFSLKKWLAVAQKKMLSYYQAYLKVLFCMAAILCLPLPLFSLTVGSKKNIFIVYHFRTQGERMHLMGKQVLLWKNLNYEHLILY